MASPAHDAHTSPVAVWRLLENLKGEDLKAWRLAEVAERASIAERNLDMPYAFGWYVACYSDELAVGQAMPLRYFDRDLVLWRGEDGRPRMLDGYCRHLGAHMGVGGRVNGNLLECPFHAWRYDESGVVHDIPYARAVPPQLKKPCTHQWPVVEQNNFVWFWYHPFGELPKWEVQHFPETGDPHWTPYERHEWNVWGSLQNMIENGVDAAHFKYVHGTASFPDYQLSFDGHCRTARVEAKMATPMGEVDGVISYGTTGPGQAWTRFSGISETLLCTAVTPVAKDHLHVRFAFTQPREQAEGPMAGLARALIRDICKQLDQDKVVWDRQRYTPDAIICDGDGPIPAFRKHFSQFYAEWTTDEPKSFKMKRTVEKAS